MKTCMFIHGNNKSHNTPQNRFICLFFSKDIDGLYKGKKQQKVRRNTS